MSVSINTKMDWKATPGYNAANGTAGEPDPKTGIVKCEAGTTARTDEVEINFCADPTEEQAEKVRSDVNNLKGGKPLSAESSDIIAKVAAQASQKTAFMKCDGVVKVSGYNRSVTASDGSTFSIKYTYDSETRQEYRDNYLSGMKDVAGRKPSDNPNADFCHASNIRNDILSYFSTASSCADDTKAISLAYNNALKEIKQNIADGKENPVDGLKTTVTVNGTTWNFSELLKTVDKMNESFAYFDLKGNLDYSDYAKMGVSRADVKSWAKENLSEDKQKMISDVLDARTETFIQREKEGLEQSRDIWDKPGFVMPEDKAEYYETHVLSATNKQAREEIMKLFEETDYSSSSAVSNTVNKYRNMMSPVFLALGASNRDLPEYLDSALNDIYKYISGLFGGKTVRGLNVSV